MNEYEQRRSEAFRFIALHQPVANDLRMARALVRITVELERVGDESKKIARFAVRSRPAPQGPVHAVARHLRHMADLTFDAAQSRARGDEMDVERARSVLAQDSELDAEFAAALRQVMTLVMQDQRFLSATIDTVFALKGLERIGDHAKNIAEQVLFVASGEDVRHQKKASGAS